MHSRPFMIYDVQGREICVYKRSGRESHVETNARSSESASKQQVYCIPMLFLIFPSLGRKSGAGNTETR